MKQAVYYGPRDIRIEQGSDAEPGPGEVLLDVTAVGICGSDLHAYMLGSIGGAVTSPALTLGHEAAGLVVALGPGVTELKVGQRVAIDPATHCGHCERCQAGDIHLCLHLKFMGAGQQQGALRERMVHPAHLCVPVPAGIGDVSAALLEPLGVALHASRLAQIQIGDDVLVIGCGAIGLLLIRLARLAGARRIFVTDRHPWRLALAGVYGADVVLNTDEVDVVAEVMRGTNKRGVDVALEAAWVSGTADQCMEAARYGGRVIIVGIPEADLFTFRARAARVKELMIQPSRRMKHVYDAAIVLAAGGQVDLERLATHRFELDQTRDAFETAGTYVDGVVRAMVLPNPQSVR